MAVPEDFQKVHTGWNGEKYYVFCSQTGGEHLIIRTCEGEKPIVWGSSNSVAAHALTSSLAAMSKTINVDSFIEFVENL